MLSDTEALSLEAPFEENEVWEVIKLMDRDIRLPVRLVSLWLSSRIAGV
jgi:hypothetical protein